MEHINPSLQYHNDPQPFTNLQMESQERGFITGEQKEIGRQCVYLCPLIFFIITLFLSIIAVIYNSKSDYHGAKDAQDSLKYLAHNLQKHMFESATAVSISKSCPKDFYVESLGTFSGIKSGCLCEDGSKHTKAYCLIKGNSNGCKYFSGAGSRDLQFWKSHKICVKKFKSWKFVHSSNNCKKLEMKKCQSNICVNGKTCPVTSLKIKKVDENHQLSNTASNKEVKFGNEHVFQALYDNKETPLVNLDSEFSNFPCISNIAHRPQSASKLNYPLNRIPQSGCGEYGNISPFSEKVDSSPFKQFYTENGLEFIEKSAPFYSSYVKPKDEIDLFGVKRIPIKNTKECVDIEPGQIHELVYGLAKVNGCIYVFAIIVIILSVIGLIVSLLFLTLRNKIPILNSKKGVIAMYVLALLVTLFAVILFACYSHYFYHGHVEHAKEHFNHLIKHKCFEVSKFENAAKETSTLVSRISKNLSWIIWTLFIFVLVWFVIYHIILAIRKKKRLDPLPNPAIL